MVHTRGTTPWYTMIASSMMYAIQDGWIALTNGINSAVNAPDKHINEKSRKKYKFWQKKIVLVKIRNLTLIMVASFHGLRRGGLLLNMSMFEEDICVSKD